MAALSACEGLSGYESKALLEIIADCDLFCNYLLISDSVKTLAVDLSNPFFYCSISINAFDF